MVSREARLAVAHTEFKIDFQPCLGRAADYGPWERNNQAPNKMCPLMLGQTTYFGPIHPFAFSLSLLWSPIPIIAWILSVPLLRTVVTWDWKKNFKISGPVFTSKTKWTGCCTRPSSHSFDGFRARGIHIEADFLFQYRNELVMVTEPRMSGNVLRHWSEGILPGWVSTGFHRGMSSESCS